MYIYIMFIYLTNVSVGSAGGEMESQRAAVVVSGCGCSVAAL